MWDLINAAILYLYPGSSANDLAARRALVQRLSGGYMNNSNALGLFVTRGVTLPQNAPLQIIVGAFAAGTPVGGDTPAVMAWNILMVLSGAPQWHSMNSQVAAGMIVNLMIQLNLPPATASNVTVSNGQQIIYGQL